MKKIFAIIVLFMFILSCTVSAGVMQIDNTSNWKLLGTTTDHKNAYADVNPNNIKIRSDDNSIIEYQLMIIDQDYNGTGYVYQVDNKNFKDRFVYRVKIKNNEIVDYYTWVQEWEPVNTNSFVWIGAKEAREAKGLD